MEAPGFKKATNPAVEIQIKSRIRVDIEMQVGAVAEVTEISSANAARLQTDTPEVGGLVSRKELQELPIINRNFLTLSALAPGTTGGGPADRRRDYNQAAVTISGASSEANNFIIDGVSDNEEFVGAASVFPPIDAIQEFKVQTSQYSAEFGRSGGGIINIAIKSVDFSVQKAFPFGETKRLVYRFEAGNLFNRGNFGLPNASFGGTDFGVIRSLAAPPRNIQMALRVEF